MMVNWLAAETLSGVEVRAGLARERHGSWRIADRDYPLN